MQCVVCAAQLENRGDKWVCPACHHTYSGNVTQGQIKELYAFMITDPTSGVEGFISYRAGVTMVMAVGSELAWAKKNAEGFKAMAAKGGAVARLVKFSNREEIPI